MSLECKNSILKDRALMLHRARLFFMNVGLTEVDTPLLCPAAPVDAHIDLIQSQMHDGKMGYFHSSPEYAMKRLIAMGLTNIFQLSHVFRYGEEGRLHNPEFTMAEWYQENFSLDQIINQTLDFIKIFLGDLPCEQLTYKDLFIEHTNLDIDLSPVKDLIQFIQERQMYPPKDLCQWDKDTLLQYILSFFIEPVLGMDKLTVLKYFPASQSALSQLTLYQDTLVSERFEIYFQGIELANGYHELTDPQEQLKRFQLSNQKRKDMGKLELPIDKKFLEALEQGLPDCSGVAVGFDRLMMLRHKQSELSQVLPFAWSNL
ncbi:MAG: EF-P lysine aminoacylase GenX [Chlamydiae bacterium]|nr:EF-P lysine aminoacylase GenX [Chlamydiota bacterium]